MRISDWSSDVCSSDLAEGDRIGVEELVGKGQLLGILLGPDEAGDAALGRALHAHAQHVGVDVGDGDARARWFHAECDVAGAPRHVEDRLAGAGLHPAPEAVLPTPVPPATQDPKSVVEGKSVSG